jgi:histidinol-phosphate aminotransferase
MIQLEKLIRKNILNLKPYSSARDEFKGDNATFLDANENPFGYLNRYPDPYQNLLKDKLSAFKNIPTENIFIGNGSDEVIDLLFRIFCNPSKDKIIICPPTYGMYEVSANINDIAIIKIPLKSDFQLDMNKIMSLNTDQEAIKMIFLCSPNNPSGNNLNEIEAVLKSFKGIVVVDEAYIDFSDANSFIDKLSNYPNLVVMQTFSKAWGLAAARVGIAYASKEIIAFLNKVKPPYNVSSLNQKAAIDAIDNIETYNQQRASILAQREWLKAELSAITCVKKIHPSDANFLLVEVSDANEIYQFLIHEKVVTRNRHSIIKNCIRITIGLEDENQKLIKTLKKY